MNPKVSIVIPTYNRAAKVQSSIKSVLAQTFSDLEVIVVDDGSSDDTGQTLRDAFGDQIRYYFQRNQGVSIARNRGIAEARGEWIAFLDSDDLWERDKLEWQLKSLEQFAPDCGACYTDTQLLNYPETRTFFQMAQENYRHEGPLGINSEALRLLVRPGGAGMLICISSLLARADAIKQSKGFDPTLGFYADSEFMFRLALVTGFCYVNRPLVWFDRSPAEIRHVGASRDWDNLEYILQEGQARLEKFLRLSDKFPPEIYKLIREQLASVHSGLANCHLQNGQYSKARAAISKAVQINPTFNFAAKWFLTWTSPRLALRAVREHQRTRENSVPSL
jgi:glycosyltransferase involved in cell wall biosynthesis